MLLKKKTDILSQKIQAIRNQTDPGSPQRATQINIDTSKFLDINSFAEFIKLNNKEIEQVSFRNEEIKRNIDDLMVIIKDKVNMKEVENIQGRYQNI